MLGSSFSLSDLWNIVPALPLSLLNTLDLSFPRNEEELVALQVEAARNGIIGAIPFGKWRKDFLVVRYFPKEQIEFHICIYYAGLAEGLTISKSGNWWFFSLLCYWFDNVEYVEDQD
ncbi:MAG: hypothetical protein U0176_23395 [Bacteroidia bacterium]